MSKQISILMLVVIVAASAGLAHADNSWSLSKLNPFKKKPTADARARASVSDEVTQRKGFPRMTMPTWASRSRTPERRKEPSTMDKISQGTKDLFGKTKNVLMPWSSDSKKKKSRAKASEKPSFLTSWLPQKETPKRPKTVNDFLKQPRPGY